MRGQIWTQRVWPVCTVVLLAFAGNALAQDNAKRPVSFEDILSLRAVESPRMSPDGEWVLYTVSAWEEEDADTGKKAWRGHVFRAPALNGPPRQLTFSERGETMPDWSPDGKWISFLSARGSSEKGEGAPKTQIWILPAAGGEARVLTRSQESVTQYAWSPDSHQVAYLTKDASSESEKAEHKRGDDETVFEHDTTMTQLWTVELASANLNLRSPPTRALIGARQRTHASSLTIRSRPSWSPDGSRIVFAAAPTTWLRDSRNDVYILELESGMQERITTNRGSDTAPSWSPDGRSIAFLAIPNESEPLPDGTLIQPLVRTRLMLYDVSSGGIEALPAGDFDLNPGNPTWMPDSRQLVFTVGDRVYREIYTYSLESKRYRKLTQNSVARFGSMSADGTRVAYTAESSSAPAEVFVAELRDGVLAQSEQRSDANPEVAGLALGDTEVVSWKSRDGVEVEGVLLKPVGYEPGRRYPTLVVIHGGPTGAHLNYSRVRYGDGGQHWAGRGWAVLYPNPRGSTNYGESFMRANLADWGGGDYRDIMSGVDALVERGIVDPERLAVQGWSYGGYMTCWTVSQTTRFKAAMIGAGLTNLVSMYGTNDIPSYLGTFFNGALSPETAHLYRERSGLTFADQVRTPTLILHGAEDNRVPIGQPMEFYRALMDRGVPTELVFYPREGHGLREYYHRLDRMQRQYEWITRYTLDDADRRTDTSPN